MSGGKGTDQCYGGSGRDIGISCESGVSVGPPLDRDGDRVFDHEDNCPTVPNADQSDRYGSARGDVCEDDSNGDGTLDADERHICVHVDGQAVIQRGAASCVSTATSSQASNVAAAHGLDSSASAAIGGNNVAVATGRGSIATASEGDDNTAMATGVGSIADASTGSGNTARATGRYSTAFAYDGDANSATATGDGGGPGTPTYASASGGDANTASAIGDESSALASGNDSTATATGDGSGATATGEAGFACADEPGEIAIDEDLCDP